MINKLPSGVKRGKGENPSKWRCIAGKIIELNRGFSGKPCLMRVSNWDEVGKYGKTTKEP